MKPFVVVYKFKKECKTSTTVDAHLCLILINYTEKKINANTISFMNSLYSSIPNQCNNQSNVRHYLVLNDEATAKKYTFSLFIMAVL